MRKDPIIQKTIEAGRENGRATLRRYQWQTAQAGNPALLIWLGKQILGQRDKIDNTIDVAKPLEELLSMLGNKAA